MNNQINNSTQTTKKDVTCDFSYTSYAKLNLFLHIVGKDKNNYHLLQSVFYKLVNLNDIIDIQINFDGIISSNVIYNTSLSMRKDECHIENNIAIKAAEKLRSSYGNSTMGADITIYKSIPIGAGLGGGSSNAAVTLLALNDLWQISTSIEKLKEIGLTLGADIPFFLCQTKMAFVEGIGEQIMPLNSSSVSDQSYNTYILLINPQVMVNTKECYQNYKGNYNHAVEDKDIANTIKHSITSENKLEFHEWITMLQKSQNALYEPACILQPIIKEVIKMLQEQSSCIIAQMSGSGSTCFGIFKNKDDVHEAYERIKALKPKWWYHLENFSI